MRTLIQLLSLAGILFLGTDAGAQVLGGIHTRMENDLREWVLLDDQGAELGHLKMRWALQGDITFWDYRFGEHSGEIRARWRDNLAEWEIHGDGLSIGLRQVWKDLATEWRITDDQGATLTFATRWDNRPGEWELREKREFGRFEMFTAWEGDPRDWVIIDEMDPRVPFPMRMGLVFPPLLFFLTR